MTLRGSQFSLKPVKGVSINVSKISRRLIFILAFIILLSPVNGYIIYKQYQGIENNALSVNNFGFLRGSIQRYEKLKLYSEHTGRERVIEEIFDKLEKEFVVPNIGNPFLIEKHFFQDFQELRDSWETLLYLNKNRLQISEKCWKISNRLTYSVQEFSEIKERDFLTALLTLILVNTFLLFIAIYIVLKLVKGELEHSAVVDPLTELYNRRFLLEQLEYLSSSYKRHKKIFSILLIDVDHFKMVNDEFGHQVGDEVLKKIAGLLKKLLRTSDMAFRYGGEEFVVIVPETVGMSAEILANRFREMISEGYLIHNKKVTVSVGVAEYVEGESIVEMLKRCDNALYEAKNGGRDKVVRAARIPKAPKKVS